MIRMISGLCMLALAAMPQLAAARDAPSATLYKNPQCMCCEAYADYLRQNGYTVTVEPTHDLSLLTKAKGVPENLEGCHLMEVGGYLVEGHVPVKHVDRLLNERPDIAGISIPGMPSGTPGMGGPKNGPITIYAFSKDSTNVYAVE